MVVSADFEKQQQYFDKKLSLYRNIALSQYCSSKLPVWREPESSLNTKKLLFSKSATGEWSKVGDMITDPDKSGQSDLPNGKTLYEGKEYDYIFNIDIDDNVVLKMPYNNDQVIIH